MNEATLRLLKRQPSKTWATSASLKGIPEELSKTVFVVSPADFEKD